MSSPGPQRFALVLGAMKCGTTSLFEYLAQHPAVAASDPKEPDYFADPSGAHDDAWYLARFAWDGTRHEVALEASNSYTKLPHRSGAPERLARFLAAHDAEARFIYLMRDPLERIESHFRHVAQFDPRRLQRRRAHILEQAIATSSYATQLAPWVARFGRDRVLLLSFDDLSKHPAAVVRRVCEFLGLDPEHRFEGLERPRHVSSRRDLALNALTRSPLFGRLWRPLPEPVRAVLKRVADRLGQRARPYLTARERRLAARALRPEVEALAATYGFSVPTWSRA